MKKAVQIGAGNIGRGLNGYVLSKNNYDITFLDVSTDLIEKINKIKKYKVIQKGKNSKIDEVLGYKGINIISENSLASQAIAESELVFISIGISNLHNLKRLFLDAIEKRMNLGIEKPLNIVAIENGINASNVLKNEIKPLLNDYQNNYCNKYIAFVNCAVDRIVPNQRKENLDVDVEVFFELVFDANKWIGEKIKLVKYSDSLEKFIERKLFMLNATHSLIAWYGIKNKFNYINEFTKHMELVERIKKLLGNFVNLIAHKSDFSIEELNEYSIKILERISNKDINDDVTRVGRGVKRKVGYNDRFMRPILYGYKNKIDVTEIVKALAYAFSGLDFDDFEVKEINEYIKKHSLEKAIKKYTGANDEITEEIIRAVNKI
ncbi:MAG: hypothetical protein HRT99_02960 [Mycoplasmatales bacterium]|nr:hypothetical protein [Mycoplasmatales bacterium]